MHFLFPDFHGNGEPMYPVKGQWGYLVHLISYTFCIFAPQCHFLVWVFSELDVLFFWAKSNAALFVCVAFFWRLFSGFSVFSTGDRSHILQDPTLLFYVGFVGFSLKRCPLSLSKIRVFCFVKTVEYQGWMHMQPRRSQKRLCYGIYDSYVC